MTDGHEGIICNCISIEGDSDTIVAIAGEIAEAYYGVPQEIKAQIWDYLPPTLIKVCKDFDEYKKGEKR